MKKSEKKAESKNEDDLLDQLQKYAETTQKAIDYSVERFDILIISLSSSGLVLSIGFVKDVIGDFSKVNPILLKITWLLFTLSLIMNLISQVSGYYANRLDLKITRDIIRIKKGKDSKINREQMDCNMKYLNSLTMALNGGSLFCLISGIVTLVVFLSKYI